MHLSLAREHDLSHNQHSFDFLVAQSFLDIFPADHDELGVWRGGYDLDRIGVLIDAFSLAKHLHWQNLANFEQDIARDFLLDPVFSSSVRPIVKALHFDLAFDSQLPIDQKVDVGLRLLLPYQTLISVQNAFFRAHEQVLQSGLFPRIEWREVLIDKFEPGVLHFVQLVDENLHVGGLCQVEKHCRLVARHRNLRGVRRSFIEDWVAEALPRVVIIHQDLLRRVEHTSVHAHLALDQDVQLVWFFVPALEHCTRWHDNRPEPAAELFDPEVLKAQELWTRVSEKLLDHGAFVDRDRFQPVLVEPRGVIVAIHHRLEDLFEHSFLSIWQVLLLAVLHDGLLLVHDFIGTFGLVDDLGERLQRVPRQDLVRRLLSAILSQGRRCAHSLAGRVDRVHMRLRWCWLSRGFTLRAVEKVVEDLVLLIVWILLIFPDELSLLLLALQSCNRFFVACFPCVLHEFVHHSSAFLLGLMGSLCEFFVALAVIDAFSVCSYCVFL